MLLEGDALVMFFCVLQGPWIILVFSIVSVVCNGGGLCVCVVGVMCCDLLAIVWCDFN